MSRKTAIGIIVAATILIIGGLLVFYFFFARGGERLEPFLPVGGEFPETGQGGFPVTRIGDDDEAPGRGAPKTFKPILTRISNAPTAGGTHLQREKELVIRYVERASGNVFEIALSGGGEKRLTNTTIPKVYDALFGARGERVLLRYLKDDGETIESFSGAVREGGADGGELVGSFLPAGILDVALSPDGSDLFYLIANGSGSSGITASLAGSGRAQVWSSPIREWLPLWERQGELALLSKPSALAAGALLFVSPADGSSRVALRGSAGFTALPSPTHGDILFAESARSSIALSIHNAAGGRSRAVPLRTLPEKCVWTRDAAALYCGVPQAIPRGDYPDVWYQGAVSFRDDVWRIDAKTGNTELVMDVSREAGSGVDLVKPELSSDEKHLLFVNKTDGVMWNLQFKE